MIQSATARKSANAERISLRAQELTDEHGLDGFTMDDLATAAGVSRRTLFNYFPGKIDAVLGPEPRLEEADVATFVAGGPEHDLVQDLRTLVLPLFETESFERSVIERFRRLLLANPRLMTTIHERYEALSAQVVSYIATREGAQFAALRARVAIAVIVAVLDSALEAYLLDPEHRPIVHHFDESLRTARSLLGT